jgi:hypothetical protein
MKLTLVFLGGLLITFSSLTFANESIDESFTFYRVDPKSKTEILSPLNKNSPI